MLHDISRPLSPSLAKWPGDVAFDLSHSATIAEGSSNNVGVLSMSLHFGTHIDAPFHYDSGGDCVEQLDLAHYCGLAAVVDVTGCDEITAGHFGGIDFGSLSKVLIKTGAWADQSVFPIVYPVLAPGVANFLGDRGIKLIGVDVPSVDKFDSAVQVNHHDLYRNGILIMESIDLTGISPGVYELTAFPLKIVGGDGSPVRAVLRDLS